MSYNYMLVCMDCKCGLDLGRLVKSSVGSEKKKGFAYESMGGYLQQLSSGGVEANYDNEFIEVLQQFMLRHHMHELRIMPETVQKYESESGDGILDGLINYESYGKFLNELPEQPSPEKEVNKISDYLIKKIREF